MEHRTYFQNFILFILTFYVKEISGALSNLRISNLGSESLEVSWDVTTDDTFSIDASISEIDDSTSTAPQILGTTSARWMRLNPGTEYKVKVGMIKRRMEVSTVIMYVTTAPAAPMEIKIMKFAHPVLNTFRVTGSKTMMYQVFGAVVSWDQPPIGGFDDFEVTVNPPDGDVRVPVVRRGGAATQGNTQQQRMVWDLTPGVMYEFVVRTIKNGVYSSPISGNQRMSPDAPNDIRVTSRTPTTATLSWDGEHRGILDNYVIETNPSDGEVTLLSGDPTQPSRRLGNLLPGAKHTAKVYSMMDGLLSFKPGVKEFYTPPAVPLGEVKSEEIRSESVFITWNRPRGELDYYEVVYYRTDQDYARLRERVWEPRLNVTALEPGRSYMTEIYSVSNDLYSEPLKQIIHTRPLPPNQVTTTATHDTVMITWKTQLLDGNTVIKYTIESENEANEVTTVTLGPGMTSTNISNLIPETKYRVTVTTMTNGVESDPVTLTIWTNPPISSDETKRTPDEPGTERKVTTTTSSIESTTEKYEALVAETTAAETTVAKRLSSETTSRPDDSKRTTKRSEQESTKATTKSTTRTSTSIKATTATSTEGETTKTPIPTTTASTTTSTSEPVITTTRKPADETTRSTRVATTTEKTTSSSTTESSTSKSEVTSETTSRRQTSGQASSTAPQPRTTTQPVSTIAARQTATETIVDSSKQTTTSSTDSSKSVSEWQSFPVVSQSTASTSLPATSGSIRRDEPTTDLPTPRTTTSPTTTKQTTTTTQSQRIDETTTIASTTASTSARQRSTSPKLSARTTDTVTSSDVKKSTAATETVSESKTTGPYSTTTSTTERVLARIDATQQYTSKESTTPKMETPTVAATTATQPHTPEKSVTSTIEPQTPDKGNRTQSTDPFETTTTVRSQTTKKPTTTGIGASITVTSTAGSTTRLMAHITHEYNTTPSKVPTTAGTTAGILPQTTKGFITTTDDVSTTVGTTANILRQTTKVFITTTDDVSTTVEETTKIQSHTTNGSTATESVRTTAGSTTRLLSPTSQKYTTTQGDVSTTAGTPTILSQGHRTTGTEAPTTWRSGTATTPRTQGDVSTTTGETPTILPQGHRTTGTEAPTPGRSGTATTPRTQDDVSTTAGETPTILSQGHGTTGTEASTTWRSGTATTSRTQGDVSTTAGETPTILPQGHRTTGTEAPTTGRSGTATTPRTQGDVSTTAGETPTIPSQGHRTTGTEASTTGRSGTATTPRTIRSETETSSQSTTKSQASTTSISQTSKPAFPPGQFKDQPTVEETTTSQNINILLLKEIVHSGNPHANNLRTSRRKFDIANRVKKNNNPQRKRHSPKKRSISPEVRSLGLSSMMFRNGRYYVAPHFSLPDMFEAKTVKPFPKTVYYPFRTTTDAAYSTSRSNQVRQPIKTIPIPTPQSFLGIPDSTTRNPRLVYSMTPFPIIETSTWSTRRFYWTNPTTVNTPRFIPPLRKFVYPTTVMPLPEVPSTVKLETTAEMKTTTRMPVKRPVFISPTVLSNWFKTRTTQRTEWLFTPSTQRAIPTTNRPRTIRFTSRTMPRPIITTKLHSTTSSPTIVHRSLPTTPTAPGFGVWRTTSQPRKGFRITTTPFKYGIMKPTWQAVSRSSIQSTASSKPALEPTTSINAHHLSSRPRPRITTMQSTSKPRNNVRIRVTATSYPTPVYWKTTTRPHHTKNVRREKEWKHSTKSHAWRTTSPRRRFSTKLPTTPTYQQQRTKETPLSSVISISTTPSQSHWTSITSTSSKYSTTSSVISEKVRRRNHVESPKDSVDKIVTDNTMLAPTSRTTETQSVTAVATTTTMHKATTSEFVERTTDADKLSTSTLPSVTTFATDSFPLDETTDIQVTDDSSSVPTIPYLNSRTIIPPGNILEYPNSESTQQQQVTSKSVAVISSTTSYLSAKSASRDNSTIYVPLFETTQAFETLSSRQGNPPDNIDEVGTTTVKLGIPILSTLADVRSAAAEKSTVVLNRSVQEENKNVANTTAIIATEEESDAETPTMYTETSTSPPQFPVQTIPIEDGFITMCEPDNITVIVNKSIIGMYEKKYGPLHFNGRCMGVEHETYYRYTIAPNISDCGTMFVKNATHVNITNTLSNSVSYNAWRSSMIDEKTGVIIGRQDEEPHPLVNLHIRCTFPTDIQVITEFIPVYEEKMISFNVSGVGKFSAIMQLFRDANYRYPYYSSPLLTMSGRLRVGITLLKTLDDYITIAARKCWATPVPDADYSVSYPLIDDFCGMKGALSGKLEILENGESKRARFEGPVFKFITHSEVWLHCELKVCFKDSCDTDCSDDGVNSRQKREAVYRPKGPIVSAGPIRRRGPPSKKPKENTSSEPDNTEISDDSINKDTLIIIVAASLAALVLLLSVVIVIVCLKYRRTSSSDKEAITNPDFNSSSLERHCNVFENPYMTESETSSRRFAS